VPCSSAGAKRLRMDEQQVRAWAHSELAHPRSVKAGLTASVIQLRASVRRRGPQWRLARAARALRTAPLPQHGREDEKEILPSPELVAVLEVMQINRWLWSRLPQRLGRDKWLEDCRALVELFPPDGQNVLLQPAHGCPLSGSMWIRWKLESAATQAMPLSAILYVHGGGFIGGSANGYAAFCGELSRSLEGAAVLSVEYASAPEHTNIPQQTESIIQAYKWLVSMPGLSKDQVIICGDSAGGGLVCLSLQQLGALHPAGAVLISLGWTLISRVLRRFRTESVTLPSILMLHSSITDCSWKIRHTASCHKG